MKTTTVRVNKSTQGKLKKLSTSEQISIAELIDRLVDEHARSFWKGFDEEAKEFLDKEEIRLRRTLESTVGDGLDK